MKRKLEINWMELDGAFQTGSWEMQSYLDLETGEVVTVTDEVSGYLEEPPEYELPDWMQGAIEQARQVEEGYGTRYVAIPQADSHEDYRDMERFISTVRNDRLRDWMRWRRRGTSARLAAPSR